MTPNREPSTLPLNHSLLFVVVVIVVVVVEVIFVVVIVVATGIFSII